MDLHLGKAIHTLLFGSIGISINRIYQALIGSSINKDIYIFILFPGGAAPSEPSHPGGLRPSDPFAPWRLRAQTPASRGTAPHGPLARADRRARGRAPHFLMHLCFCYSKFLKVLAMIYRHWEVSHFFKREFSPGMHSKSCLGTPSGPSYEFI